MRRRGRRQGAGGGWAAPGGQEGRPEVRQDAEGLRGRDAEGQEASPQHLALWRHHGGRCQGRD